MARKLKLGKLLTGLLAAVVTFLGPKYGPSPDPVNASGERLASNPDAAADRGSEGARLPFSIPAALATMHVSTISWLTTALRFKAGIMKASVNDINGMMNKVYREARVAKDRNDMKALLRATKRMMVVTDALRDRIAASSRKR